MRGFWNGHRKGMNGHLTGQSEAEKLAPVLHRSRDVCLCGVFQELVLSIQHNSSQLANVRRAMTAWSWNSPQRFCQRADKTCDMCRGRRGRGK